MELKLIFSYTIVVFFLTGTYAVHDLCNKGNEKYCNDDNCCESACTYQQLINYQLNKTSCICNNGFARNSDGDCIEQRNCGKCCGINEQLDKEAIKKNIPCSAYCRCKDGFYRLEKECVECNYSSEQKARCEIFNSKTCSCTKCKSEYKFCKGSCTNNHLNCRKYDAADTCNCINCETGYWNNEGSCVKEVAHCEKYDSNGTCVACKADKTFCNNTCVSNKCIGGAIFDSSLCICVCPKNAVLCGSECVNSACKSGWQFFCPETCQCVCREGSFSCGNSCYPIVHNCSSYNDLCKCEYCYPGYKICSEQCVRFKCNVNEYFIDAICDCGCKEGFFRNEKGVCTSTEISIEVSIFYKLFLEIIYSFLPAGYGFCHRNEFYSSWAINYEETCHGPRTPNPTERCFCRNGLIRDTRTNTCMKVCPLTGNPCDTNEIYECGPERYCKRKNLDVEIDKSSSDSKCMEKKDKNSSEKCTESRENKSKNCSEKNLSREILDVSVISDSEESEDKNKNKSKDKSVIEDVSIDETTTVNNEDNCESDSLGNLSDELSISESKEIEDESKTSTAKSKEINADVEIKNENCYIFSNEEFCGYHCSEGYGRFGSICKKCDDL